MTSASNIFGGDMLRGRRVLVTGHTGFKGAWLSEWLLALGASVHGIALPPEGDAPLFHTLSLESRLDHHECDIRDAERLTRLVKQIEPEFVFHLAAQALVRRSYRDPVGTWATNVLGTMHVLEALRVLERRVVAVVVTTDKVYRNREWPYAYREVDELGGHDPYSSSKAGCEIAVASWRASFSRDNDVIIATARAGNVLGGGDNAEDRIVPDCYRAWTRGSVAEIRNPDSTRPWQHVLEPLSGYLRLAEHLEEGVESPLTACNFGPGPGGDRRVRELATTLATLGGGREWTATESAGAVHEARALSLSIDLAAHRLGWVPLLSFEETMRWVDRGYATPTASLGDVVRDQIHTYQARYSA